MKPIPFSKWPKPIRRNITTVAMFDGDLGKIAESWGMRPRRFSHKVIRGGPDQHYWMLCFRLLNGAYGVLAEDVPGSIEIVLPIHRDEFVFDEDLDEILFTLALNPDHVDKFEGNFTWLPDRKARRVKLREEPLPEDWWNHIKVVPSRRPSKKAGV